VSPATWPRDDPREERLLVVRLPSGSLDDTKIAALPSLLAPGDLVVVNDASTLPASLSGHTQEGAPIEVRLVADLGAATFTAVLFGDRDWRTRTEDRPAPPLADRVVFAGDLSARVLAASPISPRLVTLAFEQRGAALWAALYRVGRPIQYAHVKAPLELWHTQTPFGGRPWAAEMPSAGRPLAWSVLRDLDRRGVARATITHAAGLSSTGDPALDAALPLPERYDVPAATVAAVSRARARGGRVLAVGTTVVRALEGATAARGELLPGEGTTDLRIDDRFVPRVVDGVLTGMHEPASSHFALLSAFAPRAALLAAHAHADAHGYLLHEFGDSCLLLPAARRAALSGERAARQAGR
jgi:S-adenosylmethionine:tRNA ribosyltransferase-isomerase